MYLPKLSAQAQKFWILIKKGFIGRPYSVLLGLIYMTFNAAYILLFDGTNRKGEAYVYNIMDWKNNPGKCAILACGSIVGFPIIYSGFYFLAMFRDYCWKRCQSYSIVSKDTNEMYEI